MAMCVDVISSPIETVDLTPVEKIFPQVEELKNRLTRPVGRVDLMIGASQQEIFPKEKISSLGVALFESSLTEAILISGSHPDIHMGQSDRLSEEVSRITRSHSQSIHTHRTQLNFLEAEELNSPSSRKMFIYVLDIEIQGKEISQKDYTA